MDFHIKDVLKKYIKTDRKISDAYYSESIRKYWSLRYNNSITSRTREIIFKGGKLTVKVDSAALRHELFNNRQKIIDQINDELGERIVMVLDLS